MELWIWGIIVVGGIGALWLAQRIGLIDLSDKSRRGGSSSAMGIGDEIFAPTRHEAQIELDRQTVLPAPAPLPGDGDGADGRQRIAEGERRVSISVGGDR
ncbi:hypothetical protein ACPEEZ_13170 [Frigoribacterium sp. 2-23]|uniref:hypothetical protein n=1 Tax=Frigoribacterium sp. 2-23 TaxID=3415006 RepID=UPI003C6EACEA